MIGLLLFALGLAAFLLPTSGDGQRRTAADSPAGSGGFGAAPTAAAPATPSNPTSAAATTAARTRPGLTSPAPRSPTPPTAPRRSTAGSSPSARPANGNTAQEDQVTALVNRERAAAGCGPVGTDERLRSAARGHSRDMATNDYFSHTAPNGSTFVDRAAAAGYPRDEAGGENIALGYRTPAEVMDGWMTSEGHRANILNCGFEAIGVGLVRSSAGTPYWTQVFGRA